MTGMCDVTSVKGVVKGNEANEILNTAQMEEVRRVSEEHQRKEEFTMIMEQHREEKRNKLEKGVVRILQNKEIVVRNTSE